MAGGLVDRGSRALSLARFNAGALRAKAFTKTEHPDSFRAFRGQDDRSTFPHSRGVLRSCLLAIEE